MPTGDYAIEYAGRIAAAVERKSLADLVSSLLNGKLRFALADLAALPRAAVVVEERYSQVFKLDWARPAVVADGLAEAQVRYPGVPIIFTETRQLAEEWTYRYLAAARTWAETELAMQDRLAGPPVPTARGTADPAAEERALSDPGPRVLRSWARKQGIAVPDRGRIPQAVRDAWRASQ